MNANRNIEDRVARLVAWYGDGADGASPTADQWRRIVGRPAESPVTLINFFKLRDQALYRDEALAPAAAEGGQTEGGQTESGQTESGQLEGGQMESGKAAFDRYAAVSIPTMEKIGGRFLLVAPFEAGFVGAEEDWDIVAIGSFTGKEVLLSLWEDADYHAAYPHRTAACARQKVVICNG